MSQFKDGAYYLYRHGTNVGMFTIIQQNSINGGFVAVKWIFGNEKEGLKKVWWTDAFKSAIDEGRFTLMSWEEVQLAWKIFL